MLNTQLITTLQEADIILISGQALSHCVKFTISDIAEQFGDDATRKFVLLEDTSSSVPGFEKQGQDFIDFLKSKGCKSVKSTEFLA
jgi:nicotinamidase-related amidase